MDDLLVFFFIFVAVLFCCALMAWRFDKPERLKRAHRAEGAQITARQKQKLANDIVRWVLSVETAPPTHVEKRVKSPAHAPPPPAYAEAPPPPAYTEAPPPPAYTEAPPPPAYDDSAK